MITFSSLPYYLTDFKYLTGVTCCIIVIYNKYGQVICVS